MSRTLVLLFHPDLSRSRANATLIEAARSLRDVDVVDMHALFPNGIDMKRDGEAEADRLASAARIVLQFPMQWYSTPPLLKSWQDTILTRMGYIHPNTEGARLAGKPFMVAATMGATLDTYGRDGRNGFSVLELMAPLHATANRFASSWQDPFLLYRASDLSDEDLTAAGHDYRHTLSRLAGSNLLSEVA